MVFNIARLVIGAMGNDLLALTDDFSTTVLSDDIEHEAEVRFT
jgi:hypothetical protein